MGRHEIEEPVMKDGRTSTGIVHRTGRIFRQVNGSIERSCS